MDSHESSRILLLRLRAIRLRTDQQAKSTYDLATDGGTLARWRNGGLNQGPSQGTWR